MSNKNEFTRLIIISVSFLLIFVFMMIHWAFSLGSFINSSNNMYSPKHGDSRYLLVPIVTALITQYLIRRPLTLFEQQPCSFFKPDGIIALSLRFYSWFQILVTCLAIILFMLSLIM